MFQPDNDGVVNDEASSSSPPLPDPPLRAAVVGLGWAGQQHMKAYAELPGVDLVAISGKEQALGLSLCEEFGVPLFVDDWSELLERTPLDVVSIAVPTYLHAPVAIGALQRGIHVLTEKPMARAAEEAAQMVQAARAAGQVLDVAFNHRRRGDIEALRGLIAEGSIGTPYHARASWMRRKGIPKLGSWFTNREMAGGGALLDIGVHVLDYALYALGEPEVRSVSAVTHAALGSRGLGGSERDTALEGTSEFEVEDMAAAFVRFADGTALVLETSWAAFRDPVDLMDIAVLGSDGGAELSIVGATALEAAEIRVFRDEDGRIADFRVPTRPGRGHIKVVDDFIGAVRRPEEWGLHDGGRALVRAEIIDACYRSAAEGREVTL
ncbi:Gfo/Idh/MocA family protein [Lysobacter korlensis]|uniref:Gfo/Idh/MocA family protein n=1 Tax=Lysobacter korlensis TaxID=553636 RepID=A0ABV6RS11_9GAMM